MNDRDWILYEADRYKEMCMFLDEIAELIAPCPVPDVFQGYDMCPCGNGSWPCRDTRIAWLARLQDPNTQQRIAVDNYVRHNTPMWEPS